MRLLRRVIESQSLELVADSSGLYRGRAREVTPRPPAVAAAPEKGVMELFVVRLRHARAAEVAATVNSPYGRVATPTASRTGSRKTATPARATFASCTVRPGRGGTSFLHEPELELADLFAQAVPVRRRGAAATV